MAFAIDESGFSIVTYFYDTASPSRSDVGDPVPGFCFHRSIMKSVLPSTVALTFLDDNIDVRVGRTKHFVIFSTIMIFSSNIREKDHEK